MPSSSLLVDPGLQGLTFPNKTSPVPCGVGEFTWKPGGTHLAGEHACENACHSQIHFSLHVEIYNLHINSFHLKIVLYCSIYVSIFTTPFTPQGTTFESLIHICRLVV